MVTAINPTSVSVEEWMHLTMGGLDLFKFSGFAQFVWRQNTLIGAGANDSAVQKKWVEYDIRNFVVGPHWSEVRQICPLVIASGHDQLAPDEADGMGYEVTAIKKVRLKSMGSFSRIELR